MSELDATASAMDYSFYASLAPWWPLISPLGDSAEEVAFLAEEISNCLGAAPAGARWRLLELGSGGGHNGYHLRETFDVVLVDRAEAMLAESRVLNPGSVHHQADMRDVRLNETFDVVLIHDAIDYMCTPGALLAAMATAYVHCRPGGCVLFLPDEVTETFAPSWEYGGADVGDDGVVSRLPAGASARFFEWTRLTTGEPDAGAVLEIDGDVPIDVTGRWAQCATEYVFLLRMPPGGWRSVRETHRFGLFAESLWLELMRWVGLEARVVLEPTDDGRQPRRLFVGRR